MVDFIFDNVIWFKNCYLSISCLIFINNSIKLKIKDF
jgi:hypothetical protein